MAKNGAKGKGRKGSVKGRSQVYNGKLKRWTKRNAKKRFMDQRVRKNKTFKGVRKIK
jgi:hypothetical protein